VTATAANNGTHDPILQVVDQVSATCLDSCVLVSTNEFQDGAIEDLGLFPIR
jgi:hypothetical protein